MILIQCMFKWSLLWLGFKGYWPPGVQTTCPQSSSVTKRSCCDINREKSGVPLMTSKNLFASYQWIWTIFEIQSPQPLGTSWSLGRFLYIYMLRLSTCVIYIYSGWVLPLTLMPSHTLFVYVMPALHLGLKGAAWAMERPREFPEGQGPNDLSLPCMFWCTHLVVSFMKEMEQNPMFGNQQSKSQPISRSIKNAASGVCFYCWHGHSFSLPDFFLLKWGICQVQTLGCGLGAPPWILKSLGN